MSADVNFLAAWIGLFLGLASGIIPGLLFHSEKWMGGYGSWRRRLTRLGHISFFGIGFLNLGFALSVRVFEIQGNLALPSLLFITGAISMPTVCYLSAWKEAFRHLFFIPVVSLLGATLLTLTKVWPS
jgi:hypothetical protein